MAGWWCRLWDRVTHHTGAAWIKRGRTPEVLCFDGAWHVTVTGWS